MYNTDNCPSCRTRAMRRLVAREVGFAVALLSAGFLAYAGIIAAIYLIAR